MTDFSFAYGPSVLAGSGASRRITDLAGPGPILFVTDAQLVGIGLPQPCIGVLEAAGKRVILFDAVEVDPSRATLEDVIALGRREGVTSVIGFGGGSPMDVAKLAAYLLGSADDLDALWGVGKAMGRGLPLLLVPTTAGTGSEATPIAIITIGEDEKRGVSSRALTAGHAILDPELTTGLPRSVTAATGIDAIVHAIEAYTSAHLKNPMSDLLAREALGLLGAHVLRACDDPTDLAARENMLLGAHLAGVAFANAPVGGVHALAYPLGGRFHVPHGLSNALMLPHVLRFNMTSASPLYAELAAILEVSGTVHGIPGRTADLVETLERLIAATGLPQTLRDVGVARADLDGLAAGAMLQERLLRNNPRPISRDDAYLMYEAAL